MKPTPKPRASFGARFLDEGETHMDKPKKPRPLFTIRIEKARLVLERFDFTGDRTLVRAALNKKEVPYNERYNRFYIPLSSFMLARDALRHLPMAQSDNYRAFMAHYPAGETVTIDWHPSYCKVRGGVPIDHFVKQMSYFNKDKQQLKSYKKGMIDGIEHLYHAEDGYFPSGLLDRAVAILKNERVAFTVNRHFEFPKPRFTWHPIFPFEPTEDQLRAVAALVAANSGIGKLPTGFGKTSYVAAALIAKKGVKTLFLANQRVLIDDAENDFKGVFGEQLKVGKIGDGTYDPGDVTVASIQGVVAALKPLYPSERDQLRANVVMATAEYKENPTPANKRNLTKAEKAVEQALAREERREDVTKFLQEVEMFIVDEAQGLGTSMWNTFLKACPAPYRYGLTATDTRTNGGRLEIIAATGERRYESSAEDQIAKGRLSEFRADFVEFDHGLDDDQLKGLQMDFHEAYRYFIVENEERNAILIDKLLEWADAGYSILGLVTYTDHAAIVMAELERRGVDPERYRFVSGETAKGYRQESIRLFREGKFPILLGTSIFDVGFNAKNASRMVRFNAGSSEVREPQRAGRTVRKREDGSHGEMFDILDVGCPFFKGQSFKRIKYLRDEFGHGRVKIVRKVKTDRVPDGLLPPLPPLDELPDLRQEALPF